jgi:hypothetical protein
MSLPLPKLDPKEEHFRIAGNLEGLTLFLRYLPPSAHKTDTSKIVLYVHGGSFPSALSIAHRFDGRSWRDELTDAGFHVWGLDFHGFGASDPYPEMAEPADPDNVLGRAEAGVGSSSRPRASSANIMVFRKSRSSRIPGARSQPAALPGAAPILSSCWCSSGRSRGAKRRRSPRAFPPGASSQSRTSGTGSPRRFHRTSRPFFRSATSRNGHHSTWIPIRRAGLARRPASRRRAGHGRTSPVRARAILPTTPASSRRRSRSSAANGTVSRLTPMRAGSSMR